MSDASQRWVPVALGIAYLVLAGASLADRLSEQGPLGARFGERDGRRADPGPPRPDA